MAEKTKKLIFSDLDDLSAVHIMGWVSFGDYWATGFSLEERCQPKETWKPTQNLKQAWDLMKRFKAFQLLGRYPEVKKRYECVIYTHCGKMFVADAITAPLAITRAALRASGINLE